MLCAEKSGSADDDKHYQAIDFNQSWYSQSNPRNRLKAENSRFNLFQQYDQRFDAQRKVKRHSRLPIPTAFKQHKSTAMAQSHDPNTASSSVRRLKKGRSVSDFGSPSSKQIEASLHLARQYQIGAATRNRIAEQYAGVLSTSRESFETADNGSDNDGDDSDVDDLCLIRGGHISIARLIFPMPPLSEDTTRRPTLRQARSLTSMSSNFRLQEASQEVAEQQQQQSPLRQRRCKLPLSIKTSGFPKPQIKKRKSFGVYSPPPCPPPVTPLPDLPMSCPVKQIDSKFSPKAVQTTEILDWDWNQTTMIGPASSSASSSSSTSPASSRSSSHRHSHANSRSNRPSFPLTPSITNKSSSALLPQHSTLFLNFELDCTSPQQKHLFPTKDAVVIPLDDEEDYECVYGFAL